MKLPKEVFIGRPEDHMLLVQKCTVDSVLSATQVAIIFPKVWELIGYILCMLRGSSSIL